MTDDRPRPEYGEYATPEEQAAAMGRHYVAPRPPEPEPPAAAVAPTLAGPQPGYYNRFFTMFLLVLGAFYLFGSIPSYLNFAAALKGGFSEAGISSITVPNSINAVGIPALIANVVLYAATIVLSILALRRGRTAYYIPIVGFIVFLAVFVILIALISPAYIAQLKS